MGGEGGGSWECRRVGRSEGGGVHATGVGRDDVRRWHAPLGGREREEEEEETRITGPCWIGGRKRGRGRTVGWAGQSTGLSGPRGGRERWQPDRGLRSPNFSFSIIWFSQAKQFK